MDFMDIVWLALAAVIGLLVGALVHKSVTTKRIGDADELAKRIVEEYHNGRIYVKSSQLGRGTTFCIELRA